MNRRIVVSLRFANGHPGTDDDDGLVSRLGELIRRGKAFGSELVAWGPEGLAFAFESDDAEEAITFCSAPHMLPLLRELAGAVTVGDVHLLSLPGGGTAAVGRTLLRARDISREAQPGEVLVDEQVLHGLQLSQPFGEPWTSRSVPGLRLCPIIKATEQGPGQDGLRLDLSSWQRLPMVGRASQEQHLVASPGVLSVLHASPGAGGSRLLRDHRVAVGQTLHLCPQGHGMEPLGSLRGALRARILSKQEPTLPTHARQTLLRIVDGQGVSTSHAVRLVLDWMKTGESASADLPGLVTIDDVSLVDVPSLEVITTALLEGNPSFRLLARMEPNGALPAVLAPIPPGPEVDLPALTEEQASTLALEACGPQWPEPVRRRVVDNAMTTDLTPLAILESAAHTLQHVPQDAGATRGSLPSIFPEDNVGAHVLSLRRWRLLEPGQRDLLSGLALLGGHVSEDLLSATTVEASSVPIDVHQQRENLILHGWIHRPCPGYLAINTRTQSQVALGELSSPQRLIWHRVIARILSDRPAPMDLAEAAWHAAACHDDMMASRLAGMAAQRAAEAGMDSGARHLHSFARVHQSGTRRGPVADSLVDGLQELHGARDSRLPEEVLPLTLASRQTNAPGNSAFPPVEMSTSLDLTVESLSKPATEEAPALPPPPKIPDGFGAAGPSKHLRRPVEPGSGVRARRLVPAAPHRPPDAATHETAGEQDEEPAEFKVPASNVADNPVSPTNAGPVDRQLRRAVLDGDREQVRFWAEQVRSKSMDSPLAARVSALLDIDQPESASAALHKLKEQVQREDISELDTVRNRLAYAIGLLRHGEAEHALNEGLHALALARQLKHAQAEKACLHFLKLLYERTGHDQMVSSWSA